MDLAIRSTFVRESAIGADLDLNEVIQHRVANFQQYNPGESRGFIIKKFFITKWEKAKNVFDK